MEHKLDTDALKLAVEKRLGHKVFHSKSQGHETFNYGLAQVKIYWPSGFDGVLHGRCEGKESKKYSVPTDKKGFVDVVKQTAEVLATGRTKEVGTGIGMYGDERSRDHGGWNWRVIGNPCNVHWEYLVEEIEGRSGKTRSEKWDLAPDYQRGAVWTKDQQEKFIGHALAGGEVPDVYVQRYDTDQFAPKGVDYLDLPIEVIDGQQRLRAICAFLNGDCGAQVYHSGKWHTYYYYEMNEVERRSLNGIGGMRVVYLDISREDRLRFYLRLNAGVAHTEEDLDKVRRMLVTEFPDGEGEDA